MLKKIRVVLDPPKNNNPDPEDYLDFEIDFTSKFQYDFFYDLVKDRIVMIDKWESVSNSSKANKMINIFEHNDEYSGCLTVQRSPDNYEAIWIDVIDCDKDRTLTIRIPVNAVGNLVNSLGDWFDVARKNISI